MPRYQRVLISIVLFLGGLLPLLVFWFEHGGLGTPIFTEYVTMSRSQQFAQVFAGLVIKPVYMLFSLALIIGLLGQTAREIVSMFWGLTAFLVGEIFCGINFITFRHASLISEYIHSYGMVLAFGFIAYATLEILDRRLFHITNGRCAAGELCGICKRTSPLQCAARRITFLILGLAFLVSFLPLTASVSPKSYLTDLFGYPYSYARFDLYQWYEIRALPVFALASILAALIPLIRTAHDPIPQWTKIFFSAGIGALGFSILRLALGSIFADSLVWFEFWEEATEVMFISAIGFFLWQFRVTLLEKTSTLDAVLGLIG
jgi:hypothetical protein